MRDTREQIEDTIHMMRDVINSRLNDPDDDFTEGYMTIAGEDIMIGEYKWWTAGNAKYVSNKLFDTEYFDLHEYDTMCYAIGATFLDHLVGSGMNTHLRCLLNKEDRELVALYDDDFGGDEDDNSDN